MTIRQPIVSVLGHVDHGKTTLLDDIRGSTVAAREAGKITQHIGATEVPIETIFNICGNLISDVDLKIPGLLFIDTPGHHSFTTLRARGGALADLAILIVDINEGFKPQTIESLHVLKRNKTPFVVAANKIDLLDFWKSKKIPFIQSFKKQSKNAKKALDEKIYQMIERLYDHGFNSERYDKVEDFQDTIAIVPISAKHSEGIPDLLMILIGLAQRFLSEQLCLVDGYGEGTVLEVKEERGLGKTIDTIIYNGNVKRGDTIIIGSLNKPIVTKIKALLKPKPLDEIRDPKERFKGVQSVCAAAGIKISAQNLDGVLAGYPVRVVDKKVKKLDDIINEVQKESEITIETDDQGLIIKADAIGSLEALSYELKDNKIPIKRAEIGDVSRRDVIDAETANEPLFKVILAFNVKSLPDANDALQKNEATLFNENVIYNLIENYNEWAEERKVELEKERRDEIVHPGMIKILPDCVFRISKPSVVGVRVLGGQIMVHQPLMREDGRVIGRIKSIRSGEESLKKAIMGEEVAIAITNVTYGRQIKINDILYVDIPETHAKKLCELPINTDENEVLDKFCMIKRKEKPFWGK